MVDSVLLAFDCSDAAGDGGDDGSGYEGVGYGDGSSVDCSEYAADDVVGVKFAGSGLASYASDFGLPYVYGFVALPE